MTENRCTWVFASTNQGKLAEARAALAGCEIDLVAQAELGVEPVAETGLTFVENALLKARHAARLARLPAIADDSGLCVDALQGAPGLHSARYAGVGASDAANVAKLLAALAAVPAERRGAWFVCVLVALRRHDDPDPLIAAGHWHGSIATGASGHAGFGYDPVFYLAAEGCSAAALDPARKVVLSHRGQAFAALRAALQARRPSPL